MKSLPYTTAALGKKAFRATHKEKLFRVIKPGLPSFLTAEQHSLVDATLIEKELVAFMLPLLGLIRHCTVCTPASSVSSASISLGSGRIPLKLKPLV